MCRPCRAGPYYKPRFPNQGSEQFDMHLVHAWQKNKENSLNLRAFLELKRHLYCRQFLPFSCLLLLDLINFDMACRFSWRKITQKSCLLKIYHLHCKQWNWWCSFLCVLSWHFRHTVWRTWLGSLVFYKDASRLEIDTYNSRYSPFCFVWGWYVFNLVKSGMCLEGDGPQQGNLWQQPYTCSFFSASS